MTLTVGIGLVVVIVVQVVAVVLTYLSALANREETSSLRSSIELLRSPQADHGVGDVAVLPRGYAYWQAPERLIDDRWVVPDPASFMRCTWRGTWARPSAHSGRLLFSLNEDGCRRVHRFSLDARSAASLVETLTAALEERKYPIVNRPSAPSAPTPEQTLVCQGC